MRTSEVIKSTGNSAQYNKAMNLIRTGGCLYCDFSSCRPCGGREVSRNWKQYRKTQYKPTVLGGL